VENYEPESLDKNTDLIYSPDDGGYYIEQVYPTNSGMLAERLSIVYRDRADAVQAYQLGRLTWDDELDD